MTLLSIISGLFLFIVSPIYFFFKVNKFYLRQQETKKIKKSFLVSSIITIAIITLVLLDSISFFIDKSTSIAYINFLNEIDPNDIQIYIHPISILNIISIILFGLFSFLLSVLIIKNREK